MKNMIKTQSPLVRLPLENASNCRDLGGYPTRDNRHVKWQKFLRSNNLVHLSEEDMQYLLDYGLKTIIDLRTPEELLETPTPLAEDPSIHFYNVNLTGREKKGESLIALTEEGVAPENLLKENYLVMLNTKDKIKEVFDIILHAEDGVILFNCNAGKDRTGLISMLILGLVGVADQDIITNYEISLTNIHNRLADEIDTYRKHILSSAPENIIKAMNYIEEEFGSFENYFKWVGFTTDEIIALKELIVENE